MNTLGQFAKSRATVFSLGIVLALTLGACKRVLDAIAPQKKSEPQRQTQKVPPADRQTAPPVEPEPLETKSPAIAEPVPPTVPPKEGPVDIALRGHMTREARERADVMTVAHESVRTFLKWGDVESYNWNSLVDFAEDRTNVTITGDVVRKDAPSSARIHTYSVTVVRERNLWVPTIVMIDRQLVYERRGNKITPFERAHAVRANQVDRAGRVKAAAKKAQPRQPQKETDATARWRTWTTTDGTTVTAEFQSAGAGKVKLRTEDGEQLSLEMKSLSEEDQQWIRKRR